jgi:hypothetical protein
MVIQTKHCEQIAHLCYTYGSWDPADPGQSPPSDPNPMLNDLAVPDRLNGDRSPRRQVVHLREAASRAAIDGNGDAPGHGGTGVAQHDGVIRCHAGPHVRHATVDRQRRPLLIEEGPRHIDREAQSCRPRNDVGGSINCLTKVHCAADYRPLGVSLQCLV